jgi:hypothetical protein
MYPSNGLGTIIACQRRNEYFTQIYTFVMHVQVRGAIGYVASQQTQADLFSARIFIYLARCGIRPRMRQGMRRWRNTDTLTRQVK